MLRTRHLFDLKKYTKRSTARYESGHTSVDRRLNWGHTILFYFGTVRSTPDGLMAVLCLLADTVRDLPRSRRPSLHLCFPAAGSHRNRTGLTDSAAGPAYFTIPPDRSHPHLKSLYLHVSFRIFILVQSIPNGKQHPSRRLSS